MKWLCWLLGHTHRPEHYARLNCTAVDNLGTQHNRVTADCDRCGAVFQLAMVHTKPEPDAFDREAMQIGRAALLEQSKFKMGKSR